MDKQIKIVIIILVINFLLFPFVSNHFAYYLPETHTFTVQEKGVPNGTTWGIELFDYQYGVQKELSNYYSTNSEITLNLPYGYYHYSPIVPAGYFGGSAGTDFHLSGSFVTSISVLNFLKLYNLYFEETGLPSGSPWSVTLNGPQGQITHTSNQSTASFSLPLGTYEYKAATASNNVSGIVEFPSVVNKEGFSNLVLSSSSSRVDVAFTNRTYPVIFNISAGFQVNNGNINGIGVQIDGQTHYSHFSFSTSSYTPVRFSLPDGIYQYATPNVTGYSISGGWGYVNMNSAPSYTNITYTYHTQNTG